MILLGNPEKSQGLMIEFYYDRLWLSFWGRWLSEERVWWHFGPLIISWGRTD